MDDDIARSLTTGATPLPKLKKSSDGFTRNDVVHAFQNAFDMMGGVSRLALWANQNPDKFYPLYAKLLPSTSVLIGDVGHLEIVHRIAPTALDKHEPIVVERPPQEDQVSDAVIKETSADN